ncbi:cubilin [Aphidius gifuensis]|uniref:cubilin n=1 Tax=Aphidius gifuensis TaxID=684658 RepID=UPI001CDBC25B|nr:cubilin [Aphidius gifuensis]
MQELHSQVIRLVDEVEGPNGLMKRINSASWISDGTTNSSNSPRPPIDDTTGAVNRLSISGLTSRVRRIETRLRNVITKLTTNQCTSNPCSNGGTCIRIYDGYQCICPSTWEGLNCATDVNECARFFGTDLGCQNGATCTNLPGSYRCGCTTNWSGIHCTQKSSGCNAENSAELCGKGVCVSKPGTPLGYSCICDQGWKSEGSNPACSIDVDECNGNHPACSHDPPVPCINVPGSYYCGGCPSGYTGNGYYCTDIDECSIDNGGCSTLPKVSCINTRGSYTCGSCPPGYQGNGITCVLVGACRINNGGCHSLATCIENPNLSNVIVECRCPNGYQGSGMGPQGCQAVINSCSSNPCIHGTCISYDNTFMCRCDAGYTGETCSTAINLCIPNPCKNDGKCSIKFNTITCECTASYQGPRCDTPKETCGGIIRDQSGILTYPSKSIVYSHDLSCAFVIVTNSSLVLNVTFSKFDIELTAGCRHDFLQIHDGGNAASHQLGRFCGTQLPLGGNIITTHNMIYLWLNTDSSDAKTGFTINWNSIEPICGGLLTAEHGTISSPGSPGKYSPNRDCIWEISVRPGKRIQFHFFTVLFEIHPKCDKDYLEINETLLDRNVQLGLYCNHTHPVPLVTSGSFASVHFHSDNKGQDLGFQLTYSSIEGIPGCGGIYTKESGSISTPMDGNTYEHNLVCEWKIQLPIGEKIFIDWQEFDIEGSKPCRFDYVEIFEGPNTDSPLIGKYCGDSKPPSQILDSNEALIIFNSDFTMSGKGFKLNYNTHCGGEFYETSGILKSPYYPHNYPAAKTCTYRIIQPPGKAIILKFIDLEIEGGSFESCYFDHVQVRDGDNENSTLLGEICGEIDNMPSQPFYSTHNYMFLQFKADSSIHGRGFLANYTTIDRRCGGILNQSPGTIQSPGGDNGYNNVEDCTWFIRAPPGYIVQLTWTNFNLEYHDNCASDYVTVEELFRGEALKIGTYCGNKKPPIIKTQSDIAKIRFVSDNTITSDGFTIDYIFIDVKEFCGGNYYTSNGVLYSPGYPDRYPPDRECSWVIEAPNKKRIILNITKFDLESHSECKFDHLEIRNGGYSTSPLIGKFCGDKIPSLIYSLTNQLYIKFVSDSSQGEQGFHLTWDSTTYGCGGTLSGSSGDIMSPYYPQMYAQSSECIWKIAVASGSRIQIIFVDLDLEHHVYCKFDYLEISEGVDGKKKNTNTYCGSTPPTPSTIELNSNLATIRFRSDYTNSARGFFIKYTALCNNKVHGHYGVIESPNFPNKYPTSINCSWIIDVTEGNKINLTFSHFDLENIGSSISADCIDDYLLIEEGTNEKPNTKIGKYCGTLNLPMKIASKQNQVFINFISDSYVEHSGFRLEWILNGCGGHLTRSEGIITSPNYPLEYPADTICEWLIEVDYGHSIEIYFDKIILEKVNTCSNDKVILYSGEDENSPKIAEYCYSNEAIKLTSSKNKLFIKFISDSTIFGSGFSANYKTVPLLCGGVFLSDQGLIYSQNYPKNYPHNENCEWLIEVDKNHIVNLTFIDFDIEDTTNCTDDYVRIFDGETRDNNILGSFCKSQLPPSIFSTGNKMLVVMRSDSFLSAKGFKAEFNRACGARIIADDIGELNVASNLHLRHSDERANCTWIISAYDPSDHITLRFYHMDIGDDNQDDFETGVSEVINVYEGDGTDGPLIGTWQGTKTPPPIISKGRSLTVHLFSNYSNELTFDAIYTVLNTACGGDYYSEKGNIASPNYPDSYPTNAECTWLLHVAPGNKLSLLFSKFDIESSENCDRDYLEIREISATGKLIGSYCGINQINEIKSSYPLWIKFSSDATGTGNGFLADYTFEHGNDLSGSSGEIASPLYPYPFKKSDEITWRITVDFGFSIKIEFYDFHMETYFSSSRCSYGASLRVYDGYDDEAPTLKSICGIVTPDPIQSTSNIIYLVFGSSNVNEGNWFHLHWYQVPRQSTDGENTDTVLSKCHEEISLVDSLNTTYYFNSPGWPDGYDINLNCNWIFTSPPGTHLVFRFISLDLYESNECLDDAVSIYSGFSSEDISSPEEKLLGRYCLTNQTNSYVEASNTMTVKFTTNSYMNKTGFRALVYSKCGGELKSANGEIDFHNDITIRSLSSMNYNCEWNITVRTGRKIEVKIERLSIQTNGNICGDYYLMLKNGEGPNSPLLGNGKYCGNTTYSNNVLTTTGNKLYVKSVGGGSHVSFYLTYREIGMECGGRYELTKINNKIEFSSPNYPNIPSPYSECFWTFMAPPGERLTIHFIDRFDLTTSDGCTKEYIELRDGGTDSSKLLGQFCNDIAPSSMSTTGNMLYAHFFTDIPDPKNGFKASITTGEICGGILRGKNGVITSPNYPGPYKQNQNCTWIIIAPPDHTLKIQFRDIHLPGFRLCEFSDNIEISEKLPNNDTKIIIGNYCGYNKPSIIKTSFNEAIVSFHTDIKSHINYRGFSLNFTATKDACSSHLNGITGQFKSRGYPNPNIRPIYCEWEIEGPLGTQIRVDIEDLEISNDDSYGFNLAFYNDLKTRSLIISIRKTDYPTVIKSSSNIMLVVYWSTSGRRGLKANYQAIVPAPCGGIITNEEGELLAPRVSPFNSTSYYCQWLLKPPSRILFSDEIETSIEPKTLTITVTGDIGKSRDFRPCNAMAKNIVVSDKHGSISEVCGNATQQPFIIRSPSLENTVKILNGTYGGLMKYDIKYKWQNCGGILTGPSNILKAPINITYPISCAWKVEFSDDGEVIMMKFNRLNLDSCDKGYIIVKNGGPMSPQIGKYCGNILPDNFTSSSNKLWIEYWASIGPADFELTLNTVTDGCGGLMHGSSREITSPNFPNRYSNNAECTWEIKADNGYHIGLSFVDRFNIETSNLCNNDFVEIYDWNNSNNLWNSIGKVCGRNVPSSFNSTTNRMKVIFRSNNEIEGDGFRAIWDENCGGTFEATKYRQIIESPHYPDSYDKNLYCNYTIITPENKSVFIEFNEFSLEKSSDCKYDNLTIYKNEFGWNHLPITYCGDDKPPIQLSSNKISIIFRTDSLLQKRGFQLTYFINECGGKITNQEILKPPTNSLNQYLMQQNCTWIIEAPKDKNVLLRFNMFHLEYHSRCFFDHFNVYEGSFIDSNKMIAKLCGNLNESLPVIKSKSNIMTINFHSDINNNFDGFNAQILFTKSIESGCGGNINLTKSIIWKTQSETNYESFEDCFWIIQTLPGKNIKFTITNMDLKNSTNSTNTTSISSTTLSSSCNGDFIEIRDGRDLFSDLINRYCGTNIPVPITSSLNVLWIRFASDGENNGSGAIATIEPIDSPCGTPFIRISNNTETITSPGYPNNYPLGIQCKWIISSTRAHDIHVHLTNIDMEDTDKCEGDKLQITDKKYNKFTVREFGEKFIYSGKYHSLPFSSYQRSPLSSFSFCSKIENYDYYSNGNEIEILLKTNNNNSNKPRKFKFDVSIADCNRNYTSENGRIVHQGFINCWITITVPINYTISLYFKSINIYGRDTCENSYIKIYDGSFNDENIATVCGVGLPSPIFSKTNKLSLHSNSNRGAVYENYDILYTSTDKGRGCGGKIHNYAGRFTSPMYPMNYRNRSHCVWELSVPRGFKIQLDFIVFDLGSNVDACTSDFVEIIQPKNERTLSYCGNDKPARYRSETNEVSVSYYTSKNNGGTGWVISFTAVEEFNDSGTLESMDVT